MSNAFAAALARHVEGRKEADRYSRLVAVLLLCLKDSPRGEPMGMTRLAREMERRGIDPCSRIVLDRALAVALDAGAIERRTDGRLQLPFEF